MHCLPNCENKKITNMIENAILYDSQGVSWIIIYLEFRPVVGGFPAVVGGHAFLAFPLLLG